MDGNPDQMLRWFEYQHLPVELKEVVVPFASLAKHINDTLPPCAERSVAFRKLLEAKDAAVRARIVLRDQQT